MLRTMRDNTKWIMLLTALAFVALMVFEWGMDMTGQTGAAMSGGEIGRVNGQPIMYEEFSEARRTLYSQQQDAMGGAPISNAMNRQIEDAAFEQLVMQKLIAQELRRRGISATDAEIRAAARTMPPQELMFVEQFQTDGQFDMAKYQNFLATTPDQQFLQNLESYYREMIPRQKLYSRITAGTHAPDDALWQIWRDNHDSVTVRYISLDPAELVDAATISVSDAEISDYYDEHRDDFLQPARARVKYVHIDRTPGAADSAATLERARALRAEILGGADFAEVARRESDDFASAQEGGFLSITRGQTAVEFEEAAFSQPIDSVGEPVLTSFGYHIIRVESREEDTADVRHILVPVDLRPEREDSVYALADALDELAETMPIDRIGDTLGLAVQETQLIPGLSFVPGIPQAEDGELWAFEDAAVADVSPVFETESSFYAFELVERQEERTLTLEEATERIRAALRAEKRLARAKERARTGIEQLDAGTSLEDVAASFGTEVREAGPFSRGMAVEGLGRMNAAIGTAFGLEPGETSGAVEADGRIFILEVVERLDADRAAWEQQKQAQRLNVARAHAEQRWQQYLAALRENAEVMDNRDVVFATTDDAAN